MHGNTLQHTATHCNTIVTFENLNLQTHLLLLQLCRWHLLLPHLPLLLLLLLLHLAHHSQRRMWELKYCRLRIWSELEIGWGSGMTRLNPLRRQGNGSGKSRHRCFCVPAPSHKVNTVCFIGLQCVAVCCSVLQYVAVCCSMLQYVAVYGMTRLNPLRRQGKGSARCRHRCVCVSATSHKISLRLD